MEDARLPDSFMLLGMRADSSRMAADHPFRCKNCAKPAVPPVAVCCTGFMLCVDCAETTHVRCPTCDSATGSRMPLHQCAPQVLSMITYLCMTPNCSFEGSHAEAKVHRYREALQRIPPSDIVRIPGIKYTCGTARCNFEGSHEEMFNHQCERFLEYSEALKELPRSEVKRIVDFMMGCLREHILAVLVRRAASATPAAADFNTSAPECDESIAQTVHTIASLVAVVPPGRDVQHTAPYAADPAAINTSSHVWRDAMKSPLPHSIINGSGDLG